MKITISCILFCSLCAGATDKRIENTNGILKARVAEEISGFGLEILLTKMNYIDRNLLELKLKLDQQSELMESIKALHEKTLAITTTTTTTTTTTRKPKIAPYISCKDVPYSVSGVYLIRINNASAPLKVYCEMEKYGGGWIVMQHRFDGSVDFYRNWADYRDGFGELESEFWIGLERIHQLTTARTHELIVELKDFSGDYGYARYNAFQIGSESDQYTLKTLGTCSGTAGDGLKKHVGLKFSTNDRDNDAYSNINYANYFQTGWWHYEIGSNLNGPYTNKNGWISIWWYYFKHDFRGLSFSRMMIREL
ncbi:fibrinogen-like protein A [Anopheles albimanus]|uniref:Fibrinogen C-terminal domain-containing protein n=1 Tax=Anopheles albimanus TaxID=7167 RepID=A0A8W7JBM4_ANOAL|nr:fibrinogen-like protein A [Anopheles albimanus]